MRVSKKWLVPAAAFCPFGLVLGIGVSGRVTHPHTTPQYTEAEDARVTAYQELVATRPTVPASMPVRDMFARKYADKWLRASRDRRLEPLTPAFEEDLTADNPRAEVMAAWDQAIAEMGRIVRREGKDGKVDLAIDDAIRVVGLGHVLTYSDFVSCGIGIVTQKDALSDLRGIAKRASPAQRERLRSALGVVERDQSRLTRLDTIMTGVYEEYASRQAEFARQGRILGLDYDASDLGSSGSGATRRGMQVSSDTCHRLQRQLMDEVKALESETD